VPLQCLAQAHMCRVKDGCPVLYSTRDGIESAKLSLFRPAPLLLTENMRGADHKAPVVSCCACTRYSRGCLRWRPTVVCSISWMRNIEWQRGLRPQHVPRKSVLCLVRTTAARPCSRASAARAHAEAASLRNATWLILPVVICLSQRLSHACVSMN
jgi:hypothetical protein